MQVSKVYALGVVLIMVGFVLTAVAAAIKGDWKSFLVACIFAAGNGVIFLL